MDGCTRLVTQRFADWEINWSHVRAYLCGSPGMIDASVGVLRACGVEKDAVRFDNFRGAGTTPVDGSA